MVNNTILIAITSGILVLTPIVHAATQYTLTAIGPIKSHTLATPTTSIGNAINFSGQVVGSSSDPVNKGGSDALITTKNGIVVDNNFSVFNRRIFSTSFFTGINTRGLVAGYFGRDTNDPVRDGAHAFISDKANKKKIIDLGTLGGYSSFAYGINDKNQVTGYAGTAFNEYHAFITIKGIMKDLGTLGGKNSYGYAINNISQVAGYSATRRGVHAFATVKGVMQDLGTLGGLNSRAYGINNKGQVVGESDIPRSSNRHAFVTIKGVMTDLGALRISDTSTALGINAKGQVVGTNFQPFDNSGHQPPRPAISNVRAFVTVNGKMTDLNSLIAPSKKWKLTSANAINDKGQITGVGINPKGVPSAFLLSPIK